jgi:hypothetical protein
VPHQPTFALLRDAQTTIGCVLVGPDGAAIATSSALPLIRLAAAHDGQRCLMGH